MVVFADMHTHSEFSHDSVCKIEDMLFAQRAKGVNIFAVTDHCDTLLFDKQDIYTPIKQAAEQVTQLCAQYPDMQILTGVELGDGAYFPEVAKKVLSLCDYDVVIASAHFIKTDELNVSFADVDFSGLEMPLILRYLDDYFAELVKTVGTVDFDVLAHLTYPFRYIVKKYGRKAEMTQFWPQIEALLDGIIQRGIALEVNTAYTDGKTTVPPREILEMYYKMGGRLITLGSDAHIADNAALHFTDVAPILRDIGFTEIYYYKQRQPYALPII